jgi:nucleotide-binding universal stress UspA family protein
LTGIVLVPLDGSYIAQAAIPFASWLAGKTHNSILLLRVMDEHHQDESQLAAAREELESIAASIRTEDSRISIEVRSGKPAEVVNAVAAGDEVSMVVLTTIGHGGDAKHLGAIADRLSHSLTKPALYISPSFDATVPPEGPLIVGLDGSEAAESVLDIAGVLGPQLGLELRLVRVAPWANELFAAFTGLAPPSADEEVELGTNTYLANFADRLPQGIEWNYQTLRGRTAERLIEYGADQRGILMLGSHGETGNPLWHLGGTTEKILRAASVPVLVVPVEHQKVAEHESAPKR